MSNNDINRDDENTLIMDGTGSKDFVKAKNHVAYLDQKKSFLN